MHDPVYHGYMIYLVLIRDWYNISSVAGVFPTMAAAEAFIWSQPVRDRDWLEIAAHKVHG